MARVRASRSFETRPQTLRADRRQRQLGAVALLGEPTRRALYDLVSERGTVGRDAAAEALGISRELAAFHLDRLVDGGLLDFGYRRLTGRSGPGAGRPAKVYSRSAQPISVSLPETRYETAAEIFAEGLERLAGQVGARAVADAVAEPARRDGRAEGLTVRRDLRGAASRGRRRNRLIERLAADGFEPAVDSASGTVTLGNCPYRLLSEGHRELTCGMNLAWAEGLVEAAGSVGLEPRLDPQDGRCCVVLVPTSAA